MEKTPNSLRKHVVIAGATNAGKSTLFNAMTEQKKAIVSEHAGTTTDPVTAAMELIPYGPIVLVDTAGFNDDSELGRKRMEKTKAALRKADAAIYVQDVQNADMSEYEKFKNMSIEHILVFTKYKNENELFGQYPQALFWDEDKNIETIRKALVELLQKQQPEDDSIVGDLLPSGSNVVLVVPIDSEVPKGRLILPQIQTLRDCLDNSIKSTVCRETELESVLENQKKTDLVITDSQVFGYVNKIVPSYIPLTSFSMLLARQKGNFPQLCKGTEAISGLKDGDKILMLEGCTHNSTHEDIGRVKIPRLMNKKTGKSFEFSYFSGYDFPSDLSEYSLAVQCGGCMINRREITSRLKIMGDEGLPATNYGILLAWLNGILDRSCEIFAND